MRTQRETKAENNSLSWLRDIAINKATSKRTKGITKAINTALIPMEVVPYIITSSPTLYELELSYTSIIFSLLSEELQYPLALQEAQADVC